MSNADVLSDFQSRVDGFVERSLSDYDPANHAQEKSIRDAIWGTSRFYPWEVAILDSPLVQRLRDIRQTGLAYLVYPTALHTRFDHTLGMMTVASRIVKSINDKHPSDKDLKISYTDHMQIRLSALLHDVGHSCLSHVSEAVFGESEVFRQLLVCINTTYGVTPKPHEIMSWLIVQSEPFKRFMNKLHTKDILVGWHYSAEDIDVIAENIIGYRKDPKEKFLADIVNGPMDADKLDYLVRDAYFAGPTVVYDLERFLHTVDAIEYPRQNRPGSNGTKVVRLSIPIRGVTALEQIIISKLMLFSYLYHHQKIRCVEGMHHEILKRFVALAESHTKKSKFPCLDHPVSFLNLSDRSLLPGDWPPRITGDKTAGEIIDMLTRRTLYKRALVISRLFMPDLATEENKKAKLGFDRLLACAGDHERRDQLRNQILTLSIEKMKKKEYKQRTTVIRKKLKLHHLLLDIPKAPTVEETESVMVPVSPQAKSAEDYVPLSDIFPIEKWVDAYNAIKWRGHIFTLEEAVPFVNAAAQEILSAPPYHLTFTREATELCKLDPSEGVPFTRSLL